VIDKLTHENAILKRLKFATQSVRYGAEQKSLLDDPLDSDLAAVAADVEALQPTKAVSDRRICRSGSIANSVLPSQIWGGCVRSSEVPWPQR